MTNSLPWSILENEIRGISQDSNLFAAVDNEKVRVGNKEIPLDQVPCLAVKIFETFSNDLDFNLLCLEKLKKVVVRIAHSSIENEEVLQKCKNTLDSLLILGKAEEYLNACVDFSDKTKIPLPAELERIKQKVGKTCTQWMKAIEAGQNIHLYGSTLVSNTERCYHQLLKSPLPQDLKRVDKRDIQLRTKFLEALTDHKTFYQESSPLHFAVANKNLEMIEKIFDLARIQNKAIIDLCLSPDEEGTTPLEVALLVGNEEFLKRLMQMGINLNTICIKGVPLLQSVLKDTKAFAWLLRLPEIDPTFTDYYGRTALHAAVLSSSKECITHLLAHPQGRECLSIKDHNGFTPLDLAVMEQKDDLVLQLDPHRSIEEISLHPLYGKSPLKIHQGIIIEKLERYLAIHNREESFLNKTGECNGLSFLHNYYCSIGQEDEFYQGIETIITWNGEKDRLHDASLVQAFNGKYKDLEDFFEQWMNDIFWTQNIPIAVSESYTQSDREFQYSVIQSPDEKFDLSSQIQETTLSLTLENLTKFLSILATYKKGWCFEICSLPPAPHTTAMTIDPKGQFHFYDPNGYYRRQPIKEPREIARTIQDILFSLSSIHSYDESKEGGQPFHLRVYQIGTKEKNRERLEAAHRVDPKQFKEEIKLLGISDDAADNFSKMLMV